MSRYVEELRRKSIADPKSQYPTGQCFDHALDFLWTIVKTNPQTTAMLVHGFVCTRPNDPYAHAWVEFDGNTFEPIYMAGQLAMACVPIATFYSRMKIADVTRYKPERVQELNIASGHFGPWEPHYRAACRRRGDPVLEPSIVRLEGLP